MSSSFEGEEDLDEWFEVIKGGRPSYACGLLSTGKALVFGGGTAAADDADDADDADAEDDGGDGERAGDDDDMKHLLQTYPVELANERLMCRNGWTSISSNHLFT